MADRPVSEVLRDADDALELVERGLVEITDLPGHERIAGVRNLPVWGRTLTQTLQTLRPAVGRERFFRWWAPWQAQLNVDPDFRYLWDLRNQIEKEGTVGSLGYVMHIDHLDTGQLGAPPPNAVGFFVGDRWGGAGWTVRKSDGSTEAFYAQLPGTVRSRLFFTQPTTSQRRPPPKESIDVIAHRYVELLRQIHASAREEFEPE